MAGDDLEAWAEYTRRTFSDETGDATMYDETPEPDLHWHVVYECINNGEIRLLLDLMILAPNAVMAVSRAAEPLHKLFTETGRSRLLLRKVELGI